MDSFLKKIKAVVFSQCLIMLCIAITTCGRSTKDERHSTPGDLIPIPISFHSSQGNKLDLSTALSNVKLSITNCASGYTQTNFSPTGDSISFYQHDTGCLVKVCSFTYNGEDYPNQSPPCGTFNSAEGNLTSYTGTGGANPGGDTVYIYVSQQISGPIEPGVSVEFFLLELDAVSAINLPVTSTVLSVFNDSPSAEPYSVADSTSSISFKVKLLYPNPPPTTATTVNYSIVGTAVAGTDYTAPTGSLSIPANSSSATLTIPLLNNSNAREPQSIGVNIGASSGFQGNASYLYYGSPAVIITNSDTTISTTGQVFHGTNTTFTGSTNITGWTSVSPASINTSSTTGNPTLVTGGLNSLNVAQFSGSNYMSIASNSSINQAAATAKVLSMVFVTSSDITTRQVIYEHGTTVSGMNVYIYNGKVYGSSWAGSGTPTYVSASIAPSTAYSFSFKFDSTNSLNSIYLLGSLVGQTSGPAALTSTTAVTGIGGVATSTRFENNTTTTSVTGFKGRIAELFHYNGTLTDVQIRGIHGYLDAKFNLTFPSIKINAVSTNIGENAGTVNGFMVSRAQPTDSDLVVYYSASGTAVADTNYVSLPGAVTIPAYNSTAYIPVSPLNNGVARDSSTLTLTVENDNSAGSSPVTYVGNPGSATTTIKDYAAPTSATLISWLDGAVGVTTAGGTVSAWTDQSGNSISASQSTSGNRPSNASRSYISFTGTSTRTADDLVLATNALLDSASSYTQKTFAIAFKTGSDVTTRQVIYKQGNTTNGLNITIRNSKLYFTGYGSSWGTNPNYISTSISATTNYVVIFEFDQVNNQLRGKINDSIITPVTSGVGTLTGVASSTGIGSVTSPTTSAGIKFDDGTTTTTNHNYWLGGSTNTTKPIIYEILLFNGILNSDDYKTLSNYLLAKYPI